jgi:hypothetical protein
MVMSSNPTQTYRPLRVTWSIIGPLIQDENTPKISMCFCT